MRSGPLPAQRFSRLALCTSAVIPLALVAGCAILAVPAEPARPERARIEWRDDFIREHLRFFNSSESEGRRTASVGYSRAAAYVGARMHQFGLQPAVHGDFRLIYQTPLNFPLDAELIAVENDTLVLFSGVDFLPDARSDSGRVLFDRVVVLPEGGEEEGRLEARVAVLEAGVSVYDRLPALRAKGIQAVLLVGPLRPATAVRPIRGLAIVQLTVAAATELLGSAPLELLHTGSDADLIQLRHDVRLRVVTDFQEDAGAVNVMGYLAGKHPVRREELVIVCADLDAIGSVGGVRTLDLQNFGIHASAVLELARVYDLLGTFDSVPERTLLFAVFSGSRLSNAGLKAYLQNPLWELARTVAVVYVGLPKDRELEVRNLLAPLDIPLFPIAPSTVPLYEGGLVIDPDPADVQRAGLRATSIVNTSVDLSEVLDEAVARAQQRAADAHEIVFPLATGFGEGIMPPIVDSQTEQ